MNLTIKDKHSLGDTRDAVVRLASQYSTDLEPFKDMSLSDFFSFVSTKIDYQEDPKGIEFVMRPNVLLSRGKGDCDDKTTFFLAWCILKNIPCGYAIVGNKLFKPVHHIFPFIILNGKRVDCDATYKTGVLGKTKVWAKRTDRRVI